MQSTALLIGLLAVTACSLDHVVVAALDEVAAAGAPVEEPEGSAPTAGVGGAEGRAPSAGSGGVVAAGGSPFEGDAGGASNASGGSGGDAIVGVLIPEGSGTTETRCSCVARETQVCGTDGLTYPRDCSDPEMCTPPGIACWQACPCLDGGVESGGAAALGWFPLSCVPASHCSQGVVCMTFTNSTFDDTQTTCGESN